MILQIQQQTAEWLDARCGLITASRVKDMMARGVKGQPLQRRDDYLWELVCERRSGRAVEHYVTPAMDHGSGNERYARAAYEVETGQEVDKVGMATHPRMDFLAASPDGLVGSAGMVEFKCPWVMAKHFKWMCAGEVPDEHKDQCYTQMACWEREWVDFVSYHPNVPECDQLFIKRLHRDEKRIAEIEYAAVEFNAEVEDVIAKLNGRNPFKEKLRKSIDINDPSLGITDADLPQWAKEMRGAV